jgi:hypothetical protein
MQASNPARRPDGVRVSGPFDSLAPSITSIFSRFMKFRRRGSLVPRALNNYNAIGCYDSPALRQNEKRIDLGFPEFVA